MKLRSLADSDCEASKPPVPQGATERSGEPTLPPEIAAHIGEQLQAYYAELMSEAIPERFMNLLNELGRKDREGQS